MLSRSALNKINRGDFGIQFWPCLVHLHNLAYINSNEELNKTLEKSFREEVFKFSINVQIKKYLLGDFDREAHPLKFITNF